MGLQIGTTIRDYTLLKKLGEGGIVGKRFSAGQVRYLLSLPNQEMILFANANRWSDAASQMGRPSPIGLWVMPPIQIGETTMLPGVCAPLPTVAASFSPLPDKWD